MIHILEWEGVILAGAVVVAFILSIVAWVVIAVMAMMK